MTTWSNWLRRRIANPDCGGSNPSVVSMNKIEKIKTMCCKAEWYRKSRANFRCKNCDKDVTLQIMLTYEEKDK